MAARGHSSGITIQLPGIGLTGIPPGLIPDVGHLVARGAAGVHQFHFSGSQRGLQVTFAGHEPLRPKMPQLAFGEPWQRCQPLEYIPGRPRIARPPPDIGRGAIESLRQRAGTARQISWRICHVIRERYGKGTCISHTSLIVVNRPYCTNRRRECNELQHTFGNCLLTNC